MVAHRRSAEHPSKGGLGRPVVALSAPLVLLCGVAWPALLSVVVRLLTTGVVLVGVAQFQLRPCKALKERSEPSLPLQTKVSELRPRCALLRKGEFAVGVLACSVGVVWVAVQLPFSIGGRKKGRFLTLVLWTVVARIAVSLPLLVGVVSHSVARSDWAFYDNLLRASDPRFLWTPFRNVLRVGVVVPRPSTLPRVLTPVPFIAVWVLLVLTGRFV